MDIRQWILFIPQAPAVPSSLRVSIWRRMQQMGAVTLQKGVWILPRTGEIERTLQKVLTELETQKGGGFLLTTQMLYPDLEDRLIERFRAERQQDYEEFLDRCDQFMHELEKETRAQKFTFAELEENEEDLHKLKIWLQKIHARDFFGGAQRDAASRELARCQHALKEYVAQVYSLHGYELAENPDGDQELPAEP